MDKNVQSVEAQTSRRWHDVDIKGKWELTYKTTNTIGPSAFGGIHIPIYASPFDQQKVYLKGVNGEARTGMIMDNLLMSFNPDKFVEHKNKISWLICHPWVAVKGVPGLDKKILDSKRPKKITLTYVDYQELGKYDDQDFIDKIIGRLSLEGGTKALSLTKFRHVLSYLDMTYADARFETQPQSEKKVLRSKLKTYTKKSIDTAKQVEKALNDIPLGKAKYEFKEMVRQNVLTYDNINYKYNNVPVGGDFETAEVFFINNPEVRAAALQKIYKNLE